MDLCHQVWVQGTDQATMLAAVPELPGEMMNAVWSDRETGDRCSLGGQRAAVME